MNAGTSPHLPVESARASFSQRLLRWFDRHGRHDLPWKSPATPYRVWVSEIMLQQTRVATVIPYFERFMAAFPNIQDLAAASEDDVLSLWSGLGYYARARNLRKAAILTIQQHDGGLPNCAQKLTALPGIGRSTAAAILSMGFQERAAIMDANVRRVLARCFCLAEKGSQGERTLWKHAEALTPAERSGDYAQAIMDLGALVCSARNPECEVCPLNEVCLAHQAGKVEQYPPRRDRRLRPLKEKCCIVALSPLGVLLEKRPAVGIWGGLWSFPEARNLEDARHQMQNWLQAETTLPEIQALAEIRHDFTHFRLLLKPLLVRLQKPPERVAEPSLRWWHGSESPGVPSPVRSLLKKLKESF